MTPRPTTGTTASAARARSPRELGPLNHAGLALAALLALGDVVGVAFSDDEAPGAVNGPPADVLWFGFAMGVVTLVAVALAWAGRWRTPALRIAAAARILSAIGALPAFFVTGVPAFLVAIAAATVLLTVVAVVLVLARPRHRG